MLGVTKATGSLPATAPDPAAFKEAVRSGSKQWPVLSHYLAALGQVRLIRQRLASDLMAAERWDCVSQLWSNGCQCALQAMTALCMLVARFVCCEPQLHSSSLLCMVRIIILIQ